MGFGVLRSGYSKSQLWFNLIRRVRTRLIPLILSLLAIFSLSAPAQAQTVCPNTWDVQLPGYGIDSPLDGGSVTWPIEAEFAIFLTLFDSSIFQLTSSNTEVAKASGRSLIFSSSGTTLVKVQFINPDCAPFTLNVTLKVTKAPVVGNTTSTVIADSEDNPVHLNINGYEIDSVSVSSQPANGSATASGTTITYTPADGFSGTDSFTYTATNAAGTSTPATATINVKAATHTVSWFLSPSDWSTISATVDGVPLSWGDVVALNSIVEFRVKPRIGQTYTEAPSGCGVSYAGSDDAGDLWRTAPVTADCAVTFPIFWIVISPQPYDGLPEATRGQPYERVQFATRHGYDPFSDWSWTVSDGNLPTGLSLNETTGELSGTPEEAGEFWFKVTATNGAGHAYTGAAYELVVRADNADLSALSLSVGALTPGFRADTTVYTASVPYAAETLTVTPTADDGSATIAVNGQAVASGGTSPDISLTTGETKITVEVMAQDGSTTKTYTVTVTRAAPEITLGPDSLPDGVAATAYGPINISAVGGKEPYVFAMTAGSLPEGLELAEEGTVSGTPMESGSFTVTITATDDNGFTGVREYTLTIDGPAIIVGPESLPNGTVGSAYEGITFTAEGGSGSYTFTLDGRLPEGLSFEDGRLSGTPTEAGSFTFTVTVTDANDFIGEREYILAINAPEIAVTVPSLPDGRVNAEYGPITLSASGGSAPYVFDLAAGELPEGISLANDGTLSGTPTQDGAFAVTVRATDAYGFVGIADAALTIDELNLPVARDHALEVMAGTSGSLDLTQGATGGPFTAATIAAHPESEAGVARIAREDGTHVLHFAAAGAFAGTTSLTYTLSNADGTSVPATVTINVIARPDPSLDPEVIGLIRAQAETAKRFANTQITNFNRRLEQLHEEGERRSNSIGVNLAVQQRADAPNAYAQHEERPHGPAIDAIDKASPGDPHRPAAENPFGELAFWSGGFVNFGTNDDGAINLDHTLVGVSGGVDYRFTPELTAGFGIGYGRDVTEIGSNGTESRAEAFSLATYGSYRPLPGFFIDGLAGYSTMSLDSVRYVTATGESATGSRSGDQLFASLSAGYEYRNEGMLISPYGRLSGSHSTLDGFTETGADLWNLTYGEQTIDTLSGTLGLRFQYAIPTTWGVLTPRGRLEYTHDFEGSSRASLGYADLGTLPYTIDVDGFSRDHLTIGLGLDAQIGQGTTIGFDYRTAFGTNSNSQDHTFGVKLGVQF